MYLQGEETQNSWVLDVTPKAVLHKGHFHTYSLAGVYTEIPGLNQLYGYPKPEIAVDSPKEYELKKKIIEISMECKQHKKETKMDGLLRR